MTKNFRTLLLLFAAGLLLFACSKSNNNNGEDADDHTQEQPIAHRLKIYFDNTTVDFTRFDSGIVILQKDGTVTQFYQRFTKANKSIEVEIDGLPEGKYKAIMHLNLNLKNGNKQIWRQYRYEKDLQIAQQGVVIRAPVNELKNDWKIYGVMTDAGKTFHITVPIDCTDPYFEIKSADPQWEYFYVERVAYKRNGSGRTNMGDESFECYGDCLDMNGNMGNSQTFKNWADMIATKEWDMGEFLVLVNNRNPEKDLLFQHFYDIPDIR